MLKVNRRLLALALAAGVAISTALFVGGWLFISSSFAICNLWLPAASKISGMRISASEAGFSALGGSAFVKGLSVSAPDFKVKVADLSLRASFFKAAFGSWRIESLSVSGADFTYCIAPKAPKGAPRPKTARKAAAPAAPRKIDIKAGNIKIQGSSFTVIDMRGGALESAPVFRLSSLNASLDQLEAGKESHLALSSSASADDHREIRLDSGALTATASYVPDSSLIPKSLDLNASLAVLAGRLDETDLASAELSLACALRESSGRLQIERLELDETVKGVRTANVVVSGSIGSAPLDLDLAVKMRMASSPLLDFLADYAVDSDLSKSELSYSSKLKYSASRLDCSGSLKLRDARLLPKSGALGSLDFSAEHDFSADLATKSLDCRVLNVSALSSGRRLLTASSLKPFSLCWSGPSLWQGEGRPEMEISVDELPLSVANAFLPASSGLSFKGGSINLKGLVRAGGASEKSATAALDFSAKGLSLSGHGGRILVEGAALSGRIGAIADAAGSVELSQGDLVASFDGVEAAKLSLEGSLDLKSSLCKGKASLKALNYRALDLAPLDHELSRKLKAGVKAMQPFELSLDASAECDLAKSLCKLKSLELSLAAKRFGSLACALDEPLELNWGPSGAPLGSSKLRLQSSDFDLSSVNGFLPPEQRRLRGLCNAMATASLDLAKGGSSFKGSVNLDSLPIAIKEDVQTKILLDFEGSLEGGSLLKASQIKAKTIASDGETVGFEAYLSCGYDLKTRKLDVELGSCHADGGALSKIAKMASAPASVDAFIGGLSPLDFNAKASASCDLAASKAVLSSFDASLLGKGGQFASVSLEQPFKAAWGKGAKGFQEGPSKARAVFKGFSLANAGRFIPPSSDLKFNAGALNAELLVSLEDLWRNVSADGEISTEGLDVQTSAMRVKSLDPALKGSVVLKSYAKSVEIPSFDIVFRSGKAERFKGLVKGALDFSKESPEGKLGLQISKIDEVFVSLLPFSATQKLNLKALDANGRFVWSPSASPSTPSSILCSVSLLRFASSNIQEAGHPVQFSGSLVSNVDYSPSQLAFKEFSVNASGSGRALVEDLSVSGQLRTDQMKGRSALAVSCKSIDAMALRKLFAPESGAANPAASPVGWEGSKPAQAASDVEPKAVDMKGFNGTVSLDLRNVCYGHGLNIGALGKLIIQANTVATDSMIVTVNSSPLKLSGGVDLGKSDGYEYNFSGSCPHLDLQPIAKTFSADVKGEQNNLDFRIAGKGITKRNRPKISGYVKAQYANLVLPDSLSRTLKDSGVFGDFIAILLMPLQFIAEFEKILPSGSQIDFSPVKKRVSDYKDGKTTLSFDTGILDVAAGGGIVNLNKFELKGEDWVRMLYVAGTHDLRSNGIELDTKVNADRCIIPLHVGGTLDKPKPDYARAAYDFAKDNALNILNPENLTDGTAQGILKKAEDGVDKVNEIIKLFKK